jgi:hypothetical protein
MLGCDDLTECGGAAITLLKGISLTIVQEILGPDRPQTTAIALNFTDTHIQEEFERK